MEGFTIVDGGVAVVVLISAILAYSRGLVREILSIVGWIAAAIVAYVLTPQVEPLIKEIPVLSDIIGDSCILSLIVAFALVFAVALIIVSIFTPLFSGMVQRSAVGAIDQGLGFLFGVARGLLLVLIALILYDNIFPEGDRLAMVEDSKSREILAQSQVKLAEMAPTEVPNWLRIRYDEFVGNCDDPASGT
ncbi:MAG: CvpA family protein [Rhodobacteraceae bacterium]|nr:CvpA family protein [Paracoccaceae bacterium]